MLDTFQISKTFARPPSQSELIEIGWKTIRDKQNGEAATLCFNARKNQNKPRLTLSQDRNDWWNIRAEVSLGSWLYGSNLHLPNQDELNHGLNLLNEYVKSKSGIFIDAHAARVSKVDFTRDFQVGENNVIAIIGKFAKLSVPRFKRVCYEDNSVYFKNSLEKGKLTKQFKIYSKYHERLKNSRNKSEQERAKGILRLEILHQKNAVNRLARSLKLPNHHANHILTKQTSETVIQKAMKQLHFDSLLTAENFDIEKLFELFDSASAFTLIGFLYLLYLRDKCGDDLAKQSFIDISPRTLKRYSDNCSKAGVLSLE